MKTLTITIEKGGTGKSLIATQFAFFARHFFGLRVAVIDLDQQQRQHTRQQGRGGYYR